MRLFRTQLGVLIKNLGRYYEVTGVYWDRIVQQEDLSGFLHQHLGPDTQLPESFKLDEADYLPPIVSQEVWAAGVTYRKSRSARMEEAEDAGGGGFYEKVYSAERPELFPKALPHRVAGHGQGVRIRADSRWNVPEPELTVLVSPGGKIGGYTIGNDMSSRDIEGENPLYLPQAKVYDMSCALGPCVLVKDTALPKETGISLAIFREGATVFEGKTELSEMKRKAEELVSYLFRECSFPYGCFLMTGTGIVPPSDFSLLVGDEIRITIGGIGTLINHVI